MSYLFTCSVFIFSFIIAAYAADDNLLVSLEDGSVRGRHKTSYNGRQFTAFEGIPFAKPPIGELRFEDPQPVEPWTGILEANSLHTCLQLGLATGQPTEAIGQEDCLYLNVYIPGGDKIDTNTSLDVIFNIHGGAFMLGSPEAFVLPNKIMDRDVVFVSTNYRLGPLGFINFGDGRGNYGLKDQTLALKWVQRNIGKFGGNKNSVTITGLSAGGASAHLHYFSKLSRGLFHRCFSQSGVGLNPWAFKRDYAGHSRKLAEELGCIGDIPEDLYKCLKQRNAVQITKAVNILYELPFLPLAPFGPALEDDKSSGFLTKSPKSQLEEMDVVDAPLLMSMMTEEGTTPGVVMYGRWDELNQNWVKWAPLLLEYHQFGDQKKKDEISAKIREYYLGDRPITEDNFNLVIKAITHRDFHLSGENTAKLQSKSGKSNVYFLLMNYAGEFRPINVTGFDVNFGAGHGLDAKFYNDGSLIGAKSLNKDEEKMKDILLDMLVTFAKTGEPKIDGVDFLPVPKAGDLKYLYVKNPEDMQMQTVASLGPHDLWESFNLED
ncbi:Carboxylesterase family [Popillia japonica]|uniref:Carboxylic ester hydrolase n=1 Tax=Popillia japonica TaxID=7064 RepID=A0AAW1KJM4_POPJA